MRCAGDARRATRDTLCSAPTRQRERESEGISTKNVRINPPRHNALRTGAAAALLELIACACSADESIVDARNVDDNVQSVKHCESCPQRSHDFTAPARQIAVSAPAGATQSDRSSSQAQPEDAEVEPAPTPNPFADLRFRDREPLVNRLTGLQAVPLITLWDSREATVYVGVNRKGKAGLHLRQKTDDRGDRAAQTLAAPENERLLPRPPKSRRR